MRRWGRRSELHFYGSKRRNRDFWEAAVALTHDFGGRISIGTEITRQGPDTIGGTAQTRAGVGSIAIAF